MHNDTQIVQHRSGGEPSDTRREGTCVRPAPARIAPLLSLDYCLRTALCLHQPPHTSDGRAVLSHRRLPDACSAGTATAPARRRRAAAAAARRRAEEERRSAVSGEPADPPRSGAEVGLGSAESACGAGRDGGSRGPGAGRVNAKGESLAMILARDGGAAAGRARSLLSPRLGGAGAPACRRAWPSPRRRRSASTGPCRGQGSPARARGLRRRRAPCSRRRARRSSRGRGRPCCRTPPSSPLQRDRSARAWT